MRSTCGSARRKKNKTKKTRQRAARQHILSDVITTRALYTPLVYVFSRGWSVTSTAVRFHLRVLLCRQKYILIRTAGFTPLRCMEHGWQHQKKAEWLLGAEGPTVIVGRNWSGPFRKMRCCRAYELETGEASVPHGTVEPRVHSSTPGWAASHRVEMCLPRTGKRSRMYRLWQHWVSAWRFIWRCYGWLCTPYAP